MNNIQTNSLFRPTPVNTLQKNLANFYSNTSKQVKEKFDEFVQSDDSSDDAKMLLARGISEKEQTELSGNPWLGRLVDLYA